ncbi:hypothetical protein B0A48_04664 [Cryoendolithus antarcticus]|uniref:RING-type E3 ubiquitin transferase n=1 Tax=Cryoendolithus antarcticus TaxID=1507870 RepID=A0A1V8TFZ4_9PEZI|nr:hypothetical protein B0A48_04664 [Cryoendolithus antarcticus]
MLGSPAPAATLITTATSSSATPNRPSRLRGLSYLRNKTHTHLHSSTTSRGESSAGQAEQSPPLVRSTSSPAGSLLTVAGQDTRSAVNGRAPAEEAAGEIVGTSTVADSAAAEDSGGSTPTGSMTRSRLTSALGPTTVTSISAGEGNMAGSSAGPAKEAQPSIRFIPHVETRSSRPSLHFTAVSKTLTGPNTVVRVGRYSERDTAATEENVLPVGFKSKVVSRRHCEFWCTSGQWYVKDSKSSSGTFLNHVRLSSPGAESRPYPVNDGDVVQLGIDFKGGEEIIFRCVKIRIECNRGWQKSLNSFNTSTHKRLLKTALGTGKRDSDAASVNSSECSICLNPVAPCQALFVAPCSHVWHYKCVRNLIHGPSYPNFLCPNCRFVADLEADVDPPEEEEFEELPTMPEEPNREGEAEEQNGSTGVSSDDARNGAADGNGNFSSSDEDTGNDVTTPSNMDEQTRIDNIDRTANISDTELASLLATTTLTQSPPSTAAGLRLPSLGAATSSSSTSLPVPIAARSKQRSEADGMGIGSATPTSTMQFALAAGVSVPDGPMTPRNDVGPFLFNGSAGRSSGEESREVS